MDLDGNSSYNERSYADRDGHKMFLQLMYSLLPSNYESQETIRLTLAHFAASGLHMLDALDNVKKDAIWNWVLSFRAPLTNDGKFFGFNSFPISQSPSSNGSEAMITSGSHLASTYCALCILKVTGYEIWKIDTEPISIFMKNLQQSDGSFMPVDIGGESDLRFVYCAAAVSSLLGNWSGIDVELARKYISSCQSYDGGFGLTPGAESHGGATYCAVASLRLMGCISHYPLMLGTSPGIDLTSLLDWCLKRQTQDGGFQGRINKSSDTCYAFWIGGTLRMLGCYDMMDKNSLHEFLLICQSKYGGIGKSAGQIPELYHTYYGLSALSLLGRCGIRPLCVELGISTD